MIHGRDSVLLSQISWHVAPCRPTPIWIQGLIELVPLRSQLYNCCDLTEFSTLRYLKSFCATLTWSTLYHSWSGDTNLLTLPPLAKTGGLYNYNFSKWMKSSITILLIVKILMKTVVRPNTRTNRILFTFVTLYHLLPKREDSTTTI